MITGVGPSSLPEGGRIDFRGLREDRRRRLFDAMDASDVDVLVLGRPASIVFATGARQLWTAGARPFGPACVVVSDTSRVHLLSTWDEGVPEEIPREDLFGLSWNPSIIGAHVAAIPALRSAERVGTDGFTPGFGQLVASLCPGASIVDAEPMLARARSPKSAAEVQCVSTAAAIAEASLSALSMAVCPGVTERELLGVHAASVAGFGSPVSPSEAVAWVAPAGGDARLRGAPSDRLVGSGELVVLNPGAFYAGYEATLARTWVAGSPTPAQRELAARCREAHAAVVSACRPGASGAGLCHAWDATGEAAPPAPLARGVGLGAEDPFIGHGVGSSCVLLDGQVVAVRSWVFDRGVGGVLLEDLVHVMSGGPRVLTRYGDGPLG